MISKSICTACQNCTRFTTMDQNRLDKIINLIRENMTVGAAGFTGAADPKGPSAGFDPVMGKKPRKRYIYQKGLRKNWKTDG